MKALAKVGVYYFHKRSNSDCQDSYLGLPQGNYLEQLRYDLTRDYGTIVHYHH